MLNFLLVKLISINLLSLLLIIFLFVLMNTNLIHSSFLKYTFILCSLLDILILILVNWCKLYINILVRLRNCLIQFFILLLCELVWRLLLIFYKLLILLVHLSFFILSPTFVHIIVSTRQNTYSILILILLFIYLIYALIKFSGFIQIQIHSWVPQIVMLMLINLFMNIFLLEYW